MAGKLPERCEEYAEQILREIMQRERFGGIVLDQLAKRLERIILDERRKGA